MPKSAQLADVLATDRLRLRCGRAPNLTAENETLHRLAQSLGGEPEAAMRQMLHAALTLCEAGSVGISLLEENIGKETLFRWIAVEGKLASHTGGCTPRKNSPCGVTLDRNSPQLFQRPDRYFTYFGEAQPAIVEGLVVPFYQGNTPWGTIWIVSHDPKHEFDMEDVRVMQSLSGFTTAILRLMGHTSAARTSK